MDRKRTNGKEKNMRFKEFTITINTKRLTAILTAYGSSSIPKTP